MKAIMKDAGENVTSKAPIEDAEPYLLTFGLREHPFRLAPNAQFIYRTDATNEALRHGKGVIDGRLGLGAISGEIGLGKTTIARLFAKQAIERDSVAFLYRVPGGSRQTEAQILLEINKDLEIESRDRSTAERSLRKIEEHAYDRMADGHTSVVIIDDAHLLRANGIATILALLGLAVDDHSLIQIMLFGQAPELMTVIRSDRALHSRLAMHTSLQKLNADEIRSMIVHRVESAGGEKNMFLPRAHSELFTRSNGVPRIACAIANRAAIFAHEEGLAVVSDSHVALAAERLEHHEQTN